MRCLRPAHLQHGAAAHVDQQRDEFRVLKGAEQRNCPRTGCTAESSRFNVSHGSPEGVFKLAIDFA